MSRFFLCLLLSLAGILPAHAHIGNKDVYEEVSAGPYRLFVTIRTPIVIPGVAAIEVRSSGARVNSIRVTPTPLTGEAANHPPSSDALQQSGVDPAFFSGSLWLMAAGSWQVHFALNGAGGPAMTSIPVPAMPLSILPMQPWLGITLGLLGLLLVVGMGGIAAAAVGQSRLDQDLNPGPDARRKGLLAGGITVAFAALLIYGGYTWWNAEATAYAADIYHPLRLTPVLSGNTLDLHIGRLETDARHPFRGRANNDLLPDHGHLMHLYAIRQPGMDAAFHLHPALMSPGNLRMTLPAMPAGTYHLYADVVHANGFPETLSADLTVPSGMASAPLAAEDAAAAPPALAQGELGTKYALPDGYSMVWERPTALQANTGYQLRFQLLDSAGRPAADARPYLGMAGHAAFVKVDGTVFAHTHPEGSAPMQSMMLANTGMADDGMSAGAEHSAAISPEVGFPYGFPSPGRYRIFIQMKHANTVETGVFDAEVR